MLSSCACRSLRSRAADSVGAWEARPAADPPARLPHLGSTGGQDLVADRVTFCFLFCWFVGRLTIWSFQFGFAFSVTVDGLGLVWVLGVALGLFFFELLFSLLPRRDANFGCLRVRLAVQDLGHFLRSLVARVASLLEGLDRRQRRHLKNKAPVAEYGVDCKSRFQTSHLR